MLQWVSSTAAEPHTKYCREGYNGQFGGFVWVESDFL